MDDNDRPLRLWVTPECHAYIVTSTDGHRRLVINCGGPEIEFWVDDPRTAEHFAHNVAHVAMNFAAWCYHLPGGRHDG